MSYYFFPRELLLGNNPVSVGGVDSIAQVTSRHWQASSVDFVGCMRDISIDSEVQTIESSLRWQGVIEGCGRNEGTCSRSPCGEGSICVDEWWDSWCQCQTCQRGKFGFWSYLSFPDGISALLQARWRDVLGAGLGAGNFPLIHEVQLSVSCPHGNGQLFKRSPRKIFRISFHTMRKLY